MIGEFFAAVPGQGFIEFARELFRLLDERGNDCPRGLVTVPRPEQQVALPVARNGAILDRCRPLADRDHVLDLATGIASTGALLRQPMRSELARHDPS